MQNLKKQLIEAVAARDTQKLIELKGKLMMNDFLNDYIQEDGTVSVPPSAWIDDLPLKMKKYGIN